jgi:phenylpropionate dioxygenase-like ring-hydroxylating dioxygenase large terminal subunit
VSSTFPGLERTRERLDRARHAPGYVYTSPEILCLESERLFARDWLLVGRDEEFEKPGDYRAFRVLDEPVVLARDKEGLLHAFANVCVHRGVEVASGTGNADFFSCPYHAWRYDLSGRLVTAPLMKTTETFDPRSCRMKPVRLAEWAGNLFVCFDESTPPFEDYAAEFIAAFAFVRMEECRLAATLTLEFDCNWKFIVENLMDLYHVRTLHYNTFGQYTQMDPSGITLMSNGGMAWRYTSAPSAPGGKSLFGKMSALAGESDTFAATGYLCPNFQIFVRMDQVRLFTTWPLGPGRCRVQHYSLFPAVHFAQPDFKEKAAVYRDYIARVLEEDQGMVQSLQRAMSTRAYSPGPMADLEVGIHHVLNNLLTRTIDGGESGSRSR